jgi:hypothetical protein
MRKDKYGFTLFGGFIDYGNYEANGISCWIWKLLIHKDNKELSISCYPDYETCAWNIVFKHYKKRIF